MKALLVYAHPNPQSFCQAVLKTLREELIHAKVLCSTRDLYAMDFDPVLRGEELKGGRSGERLAEIRQEQELIRDADLLLFLFPLWWSGVPAILKGYLDRVLTNGFAFEETAHGMAGLLTEKKAILYTTTGSSEEELAKQGLKEAIHSVFSAGIFDFCGIRMLDPVYFHSVPFSNADERRQMLEQAGQSIRKIIRDMDTLLPPAPLPSSLEKSGTANQLLHEIPPAPEAGLRSFTI